MKAAEHIDKAQEVLADMVEHGHLKEDFKLAAAINAAQYELQEAKRLTSEEKKGSVDG